MNNLLYLWNTYCAPWKLGLAGISFLLGLWFAWLLWASWSRRLRRATADGFDLSNNIATLRRQLDHVQDAARARSAHQVKTEVSSAMQALESVQPALDDQEEPKRSLSVFPIPKDKNAKTNLRGDLIDHRVPREWANDNVRFDKRLGVLFNERPDQVDDFTLFEGIDDQVQTKLNGYGIYLYRQVCSMSDDHLVNLEQQDPAFARVHWEFWRHRLRAKGGRSGSSALVAGETTRRVLEKKTTEKLAQQRKEGQIPVARKPGSPTKGLEHTAAIPLAKAKAKPHAGTSQPASITPPKFPQPSGPSGLGFTYGSPPATSDDLTKLQGIDRAAAMKLNKLGLYRFDQIAKWTDAEITQWQTECPELKDVSWRAWRNRLKIKGKVTIPQAFTTESIKVSPRLGLVYASKPSSANDLTKLHGIGLPAARRLNMLGLYRFDQLAHLTDSELSQWQAECPEFTDFPWIAWRHRFKNYGGRLEIPKAFEDEPVQVCPRLGIVYPDRPDSVDDFTLLCGMNADCERKLNALGIHRFKQVSHWSDSELSHLIGHDACFKAVDWKHWRRYFQRNQAALEIPSTYRGQSVQWNPRLGIVYRTAPSDTDAFTLMQGVDASDAQALNKIGIYKFCQIADWTDGQVTALTEQRSSLKKIPWRHWRKRLQALGNELAIPAAFAGESVQLSPDYGVVYRTPPAVPDQLGLLDGLSKDAETRLHGLGIHRFRQIAHLTDDQITALRKSSPDFRNVSWNLWRAHLSVHGESKATALARMRRGVPVEFAEQNHIEMDPRLGLRFRHTPPNPDLLTKMPGIDAATQAELNRQGIHTFRQLAFLNDQHFAHLRQLDSCFAGLLGVVARWKATSMRGLDARLAGRRGLGDLWRWEAWRVAQSERLIAHPTFGAIFRSAPAFVDDLRRFDGVNADMAAQLNGIGIYQFAQFMQMTAQQFSALRAHHPRLQHLQASAIQEQASRLIGKQPTQSRGRDRWRATHQPLGTGVETPRTPH